MSHEYSMGSQAVSVAGATTLNCMGALAAPSAAAQYLRHWVGQTANATSAQQRIALCTQITTFPSGLTGATPRALKFGDASSLWASGTSVAAGSAGVNATTEAGSRVVLWEDAFNVLNGYLRVNTPSECEVLRTAATLNSMELYFPAAPGTLASWSWGWNYAEV
jgi:hypothetical protein